MQSPQNEQKQPNRNCKKIPVGIIRRGFRFRPSGMSYSASEPDAVGSIERAASLPVAPSRLSRQERI